MHLNRDTLKKITISLVTLLLIVGISELIIRVIGTAPEFFYVQEGRFRLSKNPLIGYELVPHYESDTAGEMQDFTEKSNSLGFRDREHSVKKPKGSYRILVLGDSITQGWMITDRNAIFTSVLENLLTANGENVEVLNFGVNGYNTQQEVETLREKGLQFEPDLVILAYCTNDIYLDSGGILSVLERRKAQQPALKLPRIFFKSALCRQICAVIIALSRKPLPDEGFPEGRSDSIVLDSFAALEELADQHGFDVLVAAFPYLKDLAQAPDPNLFTDVKALANRNGFRFLDLSTTLSSAARIDDIVLDDLHPNPWGHKRVGEALADFISTELL